MRDENKTIILSLVGVIADVDLAPVFLPVNCVYRPHVSGSLPGVHPEQFLGLCLSAKIIVDELAKPSEFKGKNKKSSKMLAENANTCRTRRLWHGGLQR